MHCACCSATLRSRRPEEKKHLMPVRIHQQRSSTGASVADLKVLVIQYLLSILSHLLLCPYIRAWRRQEKLTVKPINSLSWHYCCRPCSLSEHASLLLFHSLPLFHILVWYSSVEKESAETEVKANGRFHRVRHPAASVASRLLLSDSLRMSITDWIKVFSCFSPSSVPLLPLFTEIKKVLKCMAAFTRILLSHNDSLPLMLFPSVHAQLFEGNMNYDTPVLRTVEPVLTRFIRVYPDRATPAGMGLRLELLGCEFKGRSPYNMLSLSFLCLSATLSFSFKMTYFLCEKQTSHWQTKWISNEIETAVNPTVWSLATEE